MFGQIYPNFCSNPPDKRIRIFYPNFFVGLVGYKGGSKPAWEQVTEWLWCLSWYFGGVLVVLVAAVCTGIVEKAVTGIWLLLVVFFRIMTLKKIADLGG